MIIFITTYLERVSVPTIKVGVGVNIIFCLGLCGVLFNAQLLLRHLKLNLFKRLFKFRLIIFILNCGCFVSFDLKSKAFGRVITSLTLTFIVQVSLFTD